MVVNLIIYSLVLLVSMLIYFKVAKHFDVVDYPVNRSSHNQPTIRGGGIIFPIAVVLWFILSGWKEPLAVTGLLIISIISFVDDVKSLPYTIRIIFHFIAIALLFNGILPVIYWYWIAAALILTVGWINAFNFMDGINGITAFYSLTLLGSFSLLNNAKELLSPIFKNSFPEKWESFLPSGLVGILFISVMIFAVFNVRKRAVTFAGDVGSISMAFLQSWMMISLMIATKQAYWILFFAVYGIDATITILIRIMRNENILKPHRLHLYQLLANEKRWPHLKVSALYALLQLFINLLTIFLYFTELLNLPVFIIINSVLISLYVIARSRIVQPS
ncbi:MAG: UDP-GlcNAc--UDP-phosphate GlcNAc-1-phosphate transferase [Bacteroidales bacterium]|nr:UDP-GlcNAc--UDP-phosphate GlcNAc-1-phosphate transferase [Bacteroidales bacterium]